MRVMGIDNRMADGILGSLFMPFLAITLLGLLNRSQIPREWRNRWWTNAALGMCALLFITFGVQHLVTVVAPLWP